MTVRPILFSGPMARALLDGRKSQTRRVLKPAKDRDFGCELAPCEIAAEVRAGKYRNTPYAPGDLLYVREAWRAEACYEDTSPRDIPFDACCVLYDADGVWSDHDPMTHAGRFRQGMHMPRWASRLTLRVSEVRVQRLQEINEEDAKAEGAEFDGEPCDHARRSCAEIGCAGPGYRGGFAALWESLNAKRGFGWDVNPWVVCVSFSVIRANVDEVLAREPA